MESCKIFSVLIQYLWGDGTYSLTLNFNFIFSVLRLLDTLVTELKILVHERFMAILVRNYHIALRKSTSHPIQYCSSPALCWIGRQKTMLANAWESVPHTTIELQMTRNGNSYMYEEDLRTATLKSSTKLVSSL